jgi:hypothetical protein
MEDELADLFLHELFVRRCAGQGHRLLKMTEGFIVK